MTVPNNIEEELMRKIIQRRRKGVSLAGRIFVADQQGSFRL